MCGARRALVSSLVLAAVACGGESPGPGRVTESVSHRERIALPSDAARSGSAEPQRTLVYECDGLDLVVRPGVSQVRLFLPDRQLDLPQVEAASGAEYRDGDVTFWSKGEEASLTVGDRTWRGCRSAPARAPWEDARLRDVTFRGVGNEPGWYVEVGPDRLRFVGDYGATTITTPVPVPAVDAATGKRTYRAATEAHEIEVVLDSRACADDMSGERFDTAVEVRLGNSSYRGCGHDPRDP